MRLHRRKGFTLVECVIAIAVFAVLTSMVLMIMASTIKLQKEASDAESNLNNVVQNVVEDNTHRVYGDDSSVIKMGFKSDNDFSITYSTVDGYRNMMRCPSCGETHNNIDYLSYIYDTATYKNWTPSSDRQSHKISYFFGQGTDCNTFKCPSCDYVFNPSAITVRCESCLREAALSLNFTEGSTGANWDYNRARGNYVCTNTNCKSEAIVQVYDDGSGNKITVSDGTEQARLMVSGITPNALRYGSVTQFKDKEVIKDLTTIDNNVCGCTAQITYTKSTSTTKPGYYTLTINGVSGLPSDGTSTTLRFTLPPHYIPNIIGGNADGLSGNLFAELEKSENFSNPDKFSTLKLTGAKYNNTNSIEVKFTLTNYKNDNSFEDDYKYDAGVSSSTTQNALTKLWFASSSTSLSIENGKRNEGTISLLTTT